MTEVPPPYEPDAASAPPDRRFDDEEFAVILKRAAELQVRTGDAAGSGGAVSRGLSLEDIRQIAREAGIDPRYVDRAVTELPTSGAWEGRNFFVGAPYAWDYQRTVPGRIPREEMVRILDALRSVMKEKGEIEDVYGTLEWHHDDSLGPVIVRISGRDDETRIEVSAKRAGEVGMWYGLAVPLGGTIGGGAIAGILGVTGPLALPLVIAMSGLSWVGTRVVWRRLSARWEQKLRLVTERVSEAAGSVARLPPATEPGALPAGDPDGSVD